MRIPKKYFFRSKKTLEAQGRGNYAMVDQGSDGYKIAQGQLISPWATTEPQSSKCPENLGKSS